MKISKYILIALGWVCVGLAFIGAIIPGIPTTIFLIIALWAFAKSSKKFHTWLLNHRKFGPILQNWESYKVVPKNAKIIMVVLQILAVIILYWFTKSLLYASMLAILLIFVARYVISLPSSVPEK
mgnify:CR=1 FL=1|tara:strand:- start:193 stop:567 length:375 start_codon:yes stop_codon:yes gene_type:complete